MQEMRYPVYFFTGADRVTLPDEELYNEVLDVPYISRLELKSPSSAVFTRTEMDDGTVYYSAIHASENLYWTGWTHRFNPDGGRYLTFDTAVVRSESNEAYRAHSADIQACMNEMALYNGVILSSTIYELRDFILSIITYKFDGRDKPASIWMKLNKDGTDVISVPDEYNGKLFIDYLTVLNHFYPKDDQDWVVDYLITSESNYPTYAEMDATYHEYLNLEKAISPSMIVFSARDVDEVEKMMFTPIVGEVRWHTGMMNGFLRCYDAMKQNTVASGVYYYDQQDTGSHPQYEPIQGYFCHFRASGERIIKENVSSEIMASSIPLDYAYHITSNGLKTPSEDPGIRMIARSMTIDNNNEVVIYYGGDIVVYDYINLSEDGIYCHRITVTDRQGNIGKEITDHQSIHSAEENLRIIPYETMMHYLSGVINVSKAN